MTQTVRDNTCRIATLVAIAFVIQTANAPAQEKKSLPRDLKKTIRKPDPRKTPPKADNTKLVQPKHKIGIPEPTVVLKPGEVPKIEFDNNGVFNFGRMKGGDAILHDFWFKNTGTGPLELLKVKPACGCTKASEHDRIVQPGERGKIPIKMATDKFNGPVSKTVTVHTNAPDAGSKITLRIKGDVWQVVSVTPAQMYFGRLSQQAISEKPLKKKVVIKNNVLAHAKLTNVRSSNPAFKPEIKTIEEGKRFELEVTVGETTRSGPNNGNIEIDTGLADKPTIKIPVSLFLAAAVDVTPSILSLPTNRTSMMKRSHYVRNNSNQPITLGDIQLPDPSLKASVEETRPGGKAFRISLEIPPEYKPAEGAQLTLKTSHPTIPTLSIPINERSTSTRPRIETKKIVSQNSSIEAKKIIAEKKDKPGVPTSQQ